MPSVFWTLLSEAYFIRLTVPRSANTSVAHERNAPTCAPQNYRAHGGKESTECRGKKRERERTGDRARAREREREREREKERERARERERERARRHPPSASTHRRHRRRPTRQPRVRTTTTATIATSSSPLVVARVPDKRTWFPTAASRHWLSASSARGAPGCCSSLRSIKRAANPHATCHC